MAKIFQYLAFVGISIALSGCGSSKIFRKADLSEHSLFVDARQRALVSASLPSESTSAEERILWCAQNRLLMFFLRFRTQS